MQQNDLNGSRKQLATSDLTTYRHFITFFDDKFAQVKYEDELTLPQLAAEILAFSADRKADLPWLKLARFGEARSRKKCLRTDANTEAVTGIEIDYDAGAMPFDAAVAALRAVNVRSIVYTSASYVAGVKEKWRVLAPLSIALAPAYREEAVAVINGVLGGVAADESFNLSTAFYYGRINDNPAHRVEVIDGDFVDLRPDLAWGAIHKAGRAAAQAHIVPEDRSRVSPGRDDAEILQLLKDSRRKNPHGGGQWHNSMLSISATMIGRGWSDAEIFSACAEYCDGHWGDEELAELITDGRAKWKVPDPDKVARGIMPVVAAAIAAKGGEVPDFETGLPARTTRDDYYAFLPTHQYIYRHTGRLYPLATINATLSKVTIGSKPKRQTRRQIEEGCEPEMVAKQIPASLWLDRNRPVMEMSWAPGEAQLIEGRLACEGGWVNRAGVASYNLYRPAELLPGNADQAGRWVEFVRTVYPDHADHIIAFCAHRIQRPAEKINHALVLTGSPGIGKDTLLEPLKYGVGPWNFREISPHDITGDYNDFMRSVVLRVSETRDLGDINRYGFYEATKTMIAAPPDMTRVNVKHVPQFYVPNVTAAVFTTNYPTDGIYLPPDDRRHYVCGTEIVRDEAWDRYCIGMWDWYAKGGLGDVIAYLATYDLSGFDAKQPPVKTAAFWRMVEAGRPAEENEFRDALDEMGSPIVLTIEKLMVKVNGGLAEWMRDRKNSRNLSRRLEDCGYVSIPKVDNRDNGRWRINGKRLVIYGRKDISFAERYTAAEKMQKEDEKFQEALKGKVIPIKP